MPLIPCPQCNHRCSIEAQACPGCGQPFKKGDLKAPGYRRVKILSALAALVFLIAVLMNVLGALQFKPRSVDAAKTDGLTGRVLALEFVQTTEQVGVILGEANHNNRSVMRTQIYLDFIWIACYGSLFLILAFFLAKRRCPWAAYLGWVAAICALGTVGFDIKENLGMLWLVNNPEVIPQGIINLEIRDAAITKWTFAFVTLAVLAVFFFGLNEKLDRIGYLFAITALLGFISLWEKSWLGILVSLPLLAGCALLAYTAWRYPEAFLREEHPVWEKSAAWIMDRKFFPWT